ncbi:MAG: DNA gyrase inhibitor YacG [Phycisphaerales bacterium]|nr:MAG: DNA gyrase inhibitor YacG [Phycisphaerales bacterium]
MPTYECPTCSKRVIVAEKEDAPWRPFCCQRCKLVDLGRWLDGSYTITEPARPEDLDEASEGNE